MRPNIPIRTPGEKDLSPIIHFVTILKMDLSYQRLSVFLRFFFLLSGISSWFVPGLKTLKISLYWKCYR